MIPGLALPAAIASWVVGGLVRLTSGGVRDLLDHAAARRERRRLLRLALLQAMASRDSVWWERYELGAALLAAGVEASVAEVDAALASLERRRHARFDGRRWCATYEGFEWEREQDATPADPA